MPSETPGCDVVNVRYYAGARAAAGTSGEHVAAGSLEELTGVLTERHGERLAVILKAASFLVDGLACHDRQAALRTGATVDVLPPFAGG
jgi:molybdopterin converting factor small subunit